MLPCVADTKGLSVVRNGGFSAEKRVLHAKYFDIYFNCRFLLMLIKEMYFIYIRIGFWKPFLLCADVRKMLSTH